MKAILLLLIGVTLLTFTGCESDVPRDPSTPVIVFGNDKFRDDVRDHPVPRATELDKTAR